jgi:hypothetical protein
MKMTWLKNRTLVLALLSSVALAARAAEPTAFELIKEGNRYVGEDAKDKVVQVAPRNPSAG